MHFNRLKFYFNSGIYPGVTTMSIEESNEEVNKAMDARFAQLRAIWDAHESALKTMRPLDFTETCYFSDPDADANGLHSFYLGLWKVSGNWKIHHGYMYEPHDQSIDWTPINDASARDRVRAAKYIHKLKEAIVESKKEFIPELDEAIAELTKNLE